MPAGIRHRLTVVAVVAATAAAGCGSHGSSVGRTAGDKQPDADFAVPARIVDQSTTPPSTVPSAADTAAPSGPEQPAPASSTPSVSPAAPTTSAPPKATTAAPFVRLAAVDDGSSDAGLATPPYADIRSLTLESDGTRARLTVTFAGSVPGHLAADEVMGVGVDLFGASGDESASQVFADGEPDGWFAYLQVGNEVGRYPGTLDVSGSSLVFTLPWSAVGDLHSGRIRAFADWSRAGTPSAASNDKAPDGTPAAFQR